MLVNICLSICLILCKMGDYMYLFLLNCYILRKIDEEYLKKMVEKGKITQEECDMIIATPQIEITNIGGM